MRRVRLFALCAVLVLVGAVSLQAGGNRTSAGAAADRAERLASLSLRPVQVTLAADKIGYADISLPFSSPMPFLLADLADLELIDSGQRLWIRIARKDWGLDRAGTNTPGHFRIGLRLPRKGIYTFDGLKLIMAGSEQFFEYEIGLIQVSYR